MMTGALPPSSRWTRLRSSAAAFATSMPARTEPVIETICGVGCWTSIRPVSLSPQTTLKTPSGRNSAAISASMTVLIGRGVARLDHDCVAGGDGGRELPDRHHHRVVPRRHLRAYPHRLAPDEGGVPFQVLPGGLALQAPGGAGEEADLIHPRRDLLLHGEPERLSRVLRLGAHQSSARSSMASAILSSASCLSEGVVSRHDSKALLADSNALFTSARLETGAEAKTSPVAGLIRSEDRPSEASTYSPPTKFCSFFLCVSTMSAPFSERFSATSVPSTCTWRRPRVAVLRSLAQGLSVGEDHGRKVFSEQPPAESVWPAAGRRRGTCARRPGSCGADSRRRRP